jgi:hypothetical protein
VDIDQIKSLILRRPRILWIVLGAMLLVSVLPLALYHRQVLQLSQEKLTDLSRKKFNFSTPTSISNWSASGKSWHSQA